jgi:hypothetical protein
MTTPIKFRGILTTDAALKAVEQDGDALRYVPEAVLTEAVALKAVEQYGGALRYVLDVDLFVKIATLLKIKIEI